MLLNTPLGVVDLQTGDLTPHDPDRLMTQITAASPRTGCSRWLAFLDENACPSKIVLPPDLLHWLGRRSTALG